MEIAGCPVYKPENYILKEAFLNLSAAELSEIIDKILPVACAAGDATLRFHNVGGTRVELKADNSPVTEADLAANAIIVGALKRDFGHIPVVSEEDSSIDQAKALASHYFLVDPLDGTKEFINGRDEFTVNIALIEGGLPVLGIVHAPALGRTFFGARDLGAFETAGRTGEGSRRISVKGADGGPLVAIASRSHRTADTDSFLRENGIDACIDAGSSLKFCRLACGDADIYPRFGPTMEWDTAAGQGVLEAAGGVVRGLSGERFCYGKDGYLNPFFVASSGCVEYTVPQQ